MSKKQSSVDNLLGELLATVKEVKNITAEQAPEIAKEMIADKIYVKKQDSLQAVVVFLVGVTLMTISYNLLQVPNEHFDPSAGHVIGVILGLVSLIMIPVGFFSAWSGIITINRIKIAPKAFLVRELSELARTSTQE